jgi:membrane-associated phospholipid phosphatase
MMVIYACSIIFSTMYMAVHWVIDVIAGIGLGHAAVLLADRVTRRWHVTEEDMQVTSAG